GISVLGVSESVPTILGSAAANEAGELRLDFTIPTSWHPGVHLLYLVNESTRRPLAVTQYVVALPDTCIGVDGADVDGDGAPDACDGDATDGPLADFDEDGVAN